MRAAETVSRRVLLKPTDFGASLVNTKRTEKSKLRQELAKLLAWSMVGDVLDAHFDCVNDFYDTDYSINALVEESGEIRCSLTVFRSHEVELPLRELPLSDEELERAKSIIEKLKEFWPLNAT